MLRTQQILHLMKQFSALDSHELLKANIHMIYYITKQNALNQENQEKYHWWSEFLSETYSMLSAIDTQEVTLREWSS